MAADSGQIQAVVALVGELEEGGFQPVLVGGMALVVLGSQRVTRDFDFLISKPAPSSKGLVNIMYGRRLELVTRFSPLGEVVHTVDSAAVATIKMDKERPHSATFFDRETGLRVDLLLDFPLAAHEVADHAMKVAFPSGHVRVAGSTDLLRLKEIAHADRKSSTDAQDLEFLRGVIKQGKGKKKD